MEETIENAKIINEMIPEAIADSKSHSKEMKSRIKLNNIFSEFENKASNGLNFFLDESNRRYTKSKCGINLKTLIAGTRKKCLDESIKILNDKFYNNNIIDEEREKMHYKNGKKYYKKIKNTLNIIRNPEIKRKELFLEDIKGINKELDKYDNNENLKELINNYNNANKNNSVTFKNNYDPKNQMKDKYKMNEIINREHKSICNSIEHYKTSLYNLKIKEGDAKINNIIENGKQKPHLKKIDFNLPKLEFLNYKKKKSILKNQDENDINKKPDIHKILPFSKYAKYFYNSNTKDISFNKSKKKNDRTLPYITEPSVHDNSCYYRNYHNTIFVVADSANKELFINKNFDKKRRDIENILGVDDIPDLKYYDKIAHEKSKSLAKERREKNELISKHQNYLKLTEKQRMNVDIERNLNLIKRVKNSLYGNEKNKDGKSN